MAINTLATATLFMTQLDKIAVQEATTGWMDANAGQVIYNGGSEVKIPKMSVQGMGDYDREAGYQRGSVTLEYETRKMTQDRGRLFQLDPMDINEANFIPTAGAVMGEFQRTQVVPEIDAYRISKLATETLTADKAGMIGESYVPGTASTSALRKLKEGIKAVRENYNGALICQATPDFIMELELELAGKITAVTFSKGGIQTQVPSVDGVPLVSTPSNRMYTAIKINNGSNALSTANTANGTANTAKNTADSANNKIDNLKIGGRNLIPIEMIKSNGLSTFSYDKASNTWTCVAPIGSNSWGRGIYFDPGVKKIYIPRGYTYIISLEVNPEVACSWNADVNNGYDGMPSGTGNDNDNTSLRKNSVQSLVANKWQRVWFSYTSKTDVSYDIFDASSNWGIVTTNATSPIKFKIRNVKGEFGTVPTDWTPAPEDVDSKINTAQKSADTANSSVSALNKIATKNYSVSGASGKAQWVRLGTLTSAGDSSVVVITLQTGNGFNGSENQNSQAEIVIKDGWQSTASTTAAFGVSVTRQNAKNLLVNVRATASNVCEVWTYLPWTYWNGNYTISGIYSGWNPNSTHQDAKPTNGVEQSLAYRTTAEDAYTLASGLKKDVDISSEFVKTYNDWAFKWKTATMVDGAEVGTYQKYITLESGNILLGHSNSKNKLKITNDSIQFKGTSDTAITPDSDATAWITGKVFHINSGEIESSLKFGKVLMKPTKNGIQIGNKAEFGERVRIGYPLSSSSQYIYSDCPLVVGSNSGVEDDFPWFAVDDGYAFVKNGIATPGDFTIKFGEYTMNRPDGGRFNGTFRPYFRADDVINMEFYVIGYVTSGKQEIIFLIPFSRPIMTKPVSISSINGLTIRQNGKYIYNSTVSKPIKPASYTAAVIGGGNGLNVKAKIAIGSNGFTDTDIKNIVNNDTCAITASIKITFS